MQTSFVVGFFLKQHAEWEAEKKSNIQSVSVIPH